MGISTNQLAAALGLQAQTLRAAVYREGHYYGLRPRRMPNGRLLWPANSLELLTKPRCAGGVQ
jgi:hypothetical protein